MWITDSTHAAIPAVVQHDGSVQILWGPRKGEELPISGRLDKLVHCTELSLQPQQNLVSLPVTSIPGSDVCLNTQVNVSALTEQLLLHILRIRYHTVSFIVFVGGRIVGRHIV